MDYDVGTDRVVVSAMHQHQHTYNAPDILERDYSNRECFISPINST